MISVKRCAATNISASHHHHQHHAHHHNQPHSQGNPNSSTTVQIRSSSAGRAASNNSAGSGSSNNNRLIRSRNSYQHIGGSGVAYTNGGYSSGGLSGGGPTNGFSSLLTNGSSGSLYHSTSNNSVLGSKSRNIGGDIYEFDSLFLVPKCALTYDKAMSLRKDLAAYDFNIRILEDTPKGNVWISGNRDANAQKQTRPSSANKDSRRRHSVAHTLHWFACVGEDIDINGFNDEEEQQKEREERIKQIKERQNEERQRKLEELKAQALAAQKFREQKEEERRRRMEDLRRRENDRRSQVEERRRAIQEADNERRQYILQKNQEREQRMETKRRNERSSIAFAFGSSTPRMIDTGDSGMSSSFWTNRRATSITNVAYTGAPLTRRSSERELPDGNSKKRATSASGLDRSTDDMRRMSSSMYEVFNWAQTSECPKKLTLSLAGAGINIDEPPSSAERAAAASARRDDSADMSYQRTVNRRKTDLMPTIPSPRDSSRSSLGTHTPRTPGRAFSMTRLDQLAQPRRRNGEHISAIIERERRQAMELENLTRLSLSSSRSSPTANGGAASKRMSRSMSQLASSGSAKYRNTSQDSHSGRSASVRKSSFNSSLLGENLMSRSDTSKSMSQLNTAGRVPRLTKAERLRQQVREQLNGSMAVTEKPPLPKISAASSGTSGGTSVERKRSQSGTSTPVRVAPAVDSATKKHSSAEKVRISSARGTPKASSTPLQSPGPDKTNRTLNDSLQQKTQKPKPKVDESSLVALQQGQTLVKQGSSVSAKSAEENTETVEQKQEQVLIQSETVSVSTTVVETAEQQQTIVTEIKTEEVQIDSAMEEHQPQLKSLEISNHEEKQDETKEANLLEPDQNGDGSTNDLMTASMIAKRITTEEEAKAALAERRRQAREEAERQAELERQRVAAEEAAEIQRQLEEEERLRKLEEETIRLAEEQRRLDEERLQQAIEEAKKRDEEERLRREEEARQKAEREESERKAREEAERQRVEMAERLKKEEKEREERRKRVEAIMSRTRAKGSANNTPTKQSDENKDDVMSKSQIVTSDNPAALLDPTMSMTESMLGSTDPQPSETDVAFPVPAEAPTSDKVDQLAQDVQSLSLVDVGSEVNQQNNNNNNNNSSSLNNNHNNNNDRNEESVAVSNSGKSNSSADYERSVTEKENFLLGSFNNNLNSNGGSGIGSSQQPSSLESSSSPVGATTNGKSTSGATTIAETTELIIEDAIMSGQTNGHKNGSIDNVFTQDLPAVDSATKPFLVTFDTSSPSATATAVDFTLSSAADVVAEQNNENHNLLDSTTFTNVTTTTATTAGQLIDFGSFQSSLADEVPQQQSATVLASDDPFNLNLNNNNNFSDHLLINSSNNGTSASPSLFTTGDANLISSSNFLNNNSARLVAASDSQDNRDLSLL
ncbi:histone-lysine N-methyltransferase, H3 lysine-79 specific isoform X5 [Wyeomyia smithii]|uniref:histone-lysine N-methyltransferase, H3 lysine-79 specific isoform X5 n=1 Tax=Wyeomyia smithii TaxID=174621 RepID=UPI002467EC87|nr:histone-lysine N-methyltransferase, H3 lysine-79 specific isoform X5 [Wyeomyia smithii]